MKIDRLIGILTTLQRHGKVTAPYLAEKFEVSRRTINRDIEDLCKAGIPIVTRQGADGGISIMDGFNLDTSVFTADELQAIFIGLKSIDSVSHTDHASRVADKFHGRQSVISLADAVMIDLSSHHKDSLAAKIELLKAAIHQKRMVGFHYYYQKGEADKRVEPYLIIFKWSSWYLFGYCPERQDFRMYKLNRLWNLEMEEHHFQARDIPADSLDFDSRLPDSNIITAVFDSRQKYRLVEEYGVECCEEREDGRVVFRRGFTNEDVMISWILSFGDAVEILEPPELRKAIGDAAKRIAERYRQRPAES